MRLKIIRKFWVHTIMLILALALSLPAAADEVGPLNKPPAPEGGQGIALPTADVSIDKKLINGVIGVGGDRYAVSEATLILGLDGRQVGIREMLVPCDAKITYVVESGKKKAERIEITRISSNATWQWISEQPE